MDEQAAHKVADENKRMIKCAERAASSDRNDENEDGEGENGQQKFDPEDSSSYQNFDEAEYMERFMFGKLGYVERLFGTENEAGSLVSKGISEYNLQTPLEDDGTPASATGRLDVPLQEGASEVSKELLTLMNDVRLGLHAKTNVVGDGVRPGLAPKLVEPQPSIDQVDAKAAVPDFNPETRKIADEPRIVISAKGDEGEDAKSVFCTCVFTMAANKNPLKNATGVATKSEQQNESEGCRRKLTFHLHECNLDEKDIVEQMTACGLLKNDEVNRNKMEKAIQAEIRRHNADKKA